jgi:hypothetical protein
VTLYSVYEPPAEAPDVTGRAEALAFVKEGFSWPALLVPGLWLLYQRMWLELILFILVFTLLAWVSSPSDDGQALLGWVSAALVVVFAFEANDLRRAALERGGYRLAGIAIGGDRDAAELAFFGSWLPRQQGLTARGRETGPERPGRAQALAALQALDPRPGAEGEEVIGLFPRP